MHIQSDQASPWGVHTCQSVNHHISALSCKTTRARHAPQCRRSKIYRAADLHGVAEHIERETLNFGDTEIVAEERARDAKRPGGGHDGSLAEVKSTVGTSVSSGEGRIRFWEVSVAVDISAESIDAIVLASTVALSH
jgi:hypothetical protein